MNFSFKDLVSYDLDLNKLRKIIFCFLGTYFPRKEVSVEEQIKAVILKPNEAVRLRAKKEMIDRDDIQRETGEEWLNRTIGSYLPLAYEEVVSTVKAFVLTDKVCVWL
jgi:major vault protein